MDRPILTRTRTHADVLEDGTVHIDSATLARELKIVPQQDDTSPVCRSSHLGRRRRIYNVLPGKSTQIPRMNIAVLITGSRGDVQPFIALGKALEAAPYHHRVRIGTHGVFRQLVQENGLEFFSIGGDPASLMSYMVRNPGILPSLSTIRSGEIGQQRAQLEEMLLGAWRACTEARDEDSSDTGQLKAFVADCIISNPPTYGSLHIAERLAIPLHFVFTMPWSPTTEFPHPLTRIDSKAQNRGRLNYLSYTQMELLTWLGLADIVNHFRRLVLMLDPIDPLWGMSVIARLKVPHTYCWSPALAPKPKDWDRHIDISGFFFLSLAQSYVPAPDLEAFLAAGEPPIYIGFGSIVVDNSEQFSELIFDAIRKSGVRAVVSRGWSKIDGANLGDNIFMLGNVPHDWLFSRVSAVVHHGGAGTCAIGLALGKPTVIVPFFGDQFWWAEVVARSGAGPEGVPYKKLTSDKLASGIKQALKSEMMKRACELSDKIRKEDGLANAVKHFHDVQEVERLACFLYPHRVASTRIRRTNIQLSTLAVAVLMKHRKIKPNDVELIRHRRWYVEEGAPEPLSGEIAAIVDALRACMADVKQCKRDISRNRQCDGDASLKQRRDTISADASPNISATFTSINKHAYLNLAKSLAVDLGTGTVNFFYNTANGFHNLPATMLGDKTVRQRDAITGVVSGLEVSAKQMIFGLYDGLAGLALHPYHGYIHGHRRKGGPLWGGFKGLGRGLGGLLCRSGTVTFALPGYGLKGLEQQLLRLGEHPQRMQEVSNNIIEDTRRAITSKSSREQRTIIKDEWLRLATGRPLLQRRIWQSFDELHELIENDSGEEKEMLRRWELLIAQSPGKGAS